MHAQRRLAEDRVRSRSDPSPPVERMPEFWLRTDEREDLLSSLGMLSLACEQAVTDIAAWKWIVTMTHSALQGAMAFHLGFGNDLLVAKPKHATKWLRAHRDRSPYPEMMMDSFLGLYGKLQKHEILGYKFVGTH